MFAYVWHWILWLFFYSTWELDTLTLSAKQLLGLVPYRFVSLIIHTSCVCVFAPSLPSVAGLQELLQHAAARLLLCVGAWNQSSQKKTAPGTQGPGLSAVLYVDVVVGARPSPGVACGEPLSLAANWDLAGALWGFGFGMAGVRISFKSICCVFFQQAASK